MHSVEHVADVGSVSGSLQGLDNTGQAPIFTLPQQLLLPHLVQSQRTPHTGQQPPLKMRQRQHWRFDLGTMQHLQPITVENHAIQNNMRHGLTLLGTPGYETGSGPHGQQRLSPGMEAHRAATQRRFVLLELNDVKRGAPRSTRVEEADASPPRAGGERHRSPYGGGTGLNFFILLLLRFFRVGIRIVVFVHVHGVILAFLLLGGLFAGGIEPQALFTVGVVIVVIALAHRQQPPRLAAGIPRQLQQTHLPRRIPQTHAMLVETLPPIPPGFHTQNPQRAPRRGHNPLLHERPPEHRGVIQRGVTQRIGRHRTGGSIVPRDPRPGGEQYRRGLGIHRGPQCRHGTRAEKPLVGTARGSPGDGIDGNPNARSIVHPHREPDILAGALEAHAVRTALQYRAGFLD
mmetsp:Transcript_58535/g.68349  ORF Transcript_58535/g.68349 Transcript_58535/m.68349 type:complete len:403 (+) Transcript_58535:174-1382(+)